MENNNIFTRMHEAVTVICSNSEDEVFLMSMIAEIKRLFPIFSKDICNTTLLEETEEHYLRNIDECIDNFYLVYYPEVRRNKEIAEGKEYKEFLSLLKILKEAIKSYFMPPTFEPQQIEPTYKLLIENKTAICDVMGVSPDTFASELDRWLQRKGAHVKKYSDGLVNLFHNNINLIEQLNGLSDDKIAAQITTWKKQKDKLGRPLIENPDNLLKSTFARELEANGIIKCSNKTFRSKL